jgi:hypothetical protein
VLMIQRDDDDDGASEYRRRRQRQQQQQQHSWHICVRCRSRRPTCDNQWMQLANIASDIEFKKRCALEHCVQPQSAARIWTASALCRQCATRLLLLPKTANPCDRAQCT